MKARVSGVELGPEGSALPRLPGEWVESPDGRVFVTGESYEVSHVQGARSLREFLSLSAETLSTLCREPLLAGVDLSSALFLDTETTGLDPSTGSLAFLVGAGYYEGASFRVRQYFLERSAGERAMLREVRDFVESFGLLVTFNGKAFDVPMLATRLEAHGVAHRLGRMPHADLLHPARRLWKERLQSCRLSSLERNLLSVGRTGDVPGRLIPDLYARYRADGDAAPLLPVFYHNAQDLLTLPALASHAGCAYSDPFGGGVSDGLDFLSLGRVYEAAGELEMAVRAYDRALSLPLHPAARMDACRRITPLYKRAGQLAHAVALWEGMAHSEDTHGIYPLEELAKHYEHSTGELARAEELVIRALRRLPRDTCTRTTRRDLEKRLHRIQAKRAAKGE